MQRKIGVVYVAMALVACMGLTAHAQSTTFSSGSDGSDGALYIPSGTHVVLELPEDGIFNFTAINIDEGGKLSFEKNSLNTPVYMLATRDVNITGQIDISGECGKVSPPVGGAGGPGGFDGGMPGILGADPGAGQGPGGGLPGNAENDSHSGNAGGGAYGTAPADVNPEDGEAYGSPLLVPLIGGSGGGGTTGQPGRGGGGGGGAILIASDTAINIISSSTGGIYSRGGHNDKQNGESNAYLSPAQGAGGAIRLVAPVVAGDGFLDARGGHADDYYNVWGGHGRIRIDTMDRSGISFNFKPLEVVSLGSFMQVFPEPLPQLDIVHAAGVDIPAGTSSSVSIFMPFESPTTQLVTVQGTDFEGTVPLDVVVTPDNGSPTIYDATLDMSVANPTTTSVSVELTVNTTNHIHVWTKRN